MVNCVNLELPPGATLSPCIEGLGVNGMSVTFKCTRLFKWTPLTTVSYAVSWVTRDSQNLQSTSLQDAIAIGIDVPNIIVKIGNFQLSNDPSQVCTSTYLRVHTSIYL